MANTREQVEAMKPKDRHFGEWLADWFNFANGPGKDNAEYDRKKAEYERALAQYEETARNEERRQYQEQQSQKAIQPYKASDFANALEASASQNQAQSRDFFRSALEKAYTPSQQQSAEARDAQAAAAAKAYQDYLSGGMQQEQLAQQREYAEYLKSMMQPGAMSAVSSEVIKQGMEAAQRKALSTAASQRGMSTALASRAAAQEQAAISQQAAQQAALQAAQEQKEVRDQYGNLIIQGRSQSIEAQAKLAAATQQLQEALRTGDQNAINAALTAISNLRQGDITMTDQAQQERQLEMNKQIAEMQAQMNAAIAELQNMFNQGKLTLDQFEAEKDRVSKMWMSIIAGATNVAAGFAKSAKGGKIQKPKRVPGQAKHAGDDERNDTVPALLSPGEIVIPRSIAQSPDADKKSAEFVRQLMKQEKSGPRSKRSAMSRIAKLEAELAALKANSSNKDEG